MRQQIKANIHKIDKGQSGRVVIYMASQIILQGIAVVAMPLFTRLLTTDQYGQVAIFCAWSSILALIVGLKVESTISMTKAHYAEDQFGQFCSNAFFVVFTTGGAALLIVIGFRKGLSNLLHTEPILLALMVCYTFGLVCTKVQSSIFMITKQAVKEVALSIFLSFSECALSVILIILMRGWEFYGRILGISIPSIILGSIFCILHMRRIREYLDIEMLKYMVLLSAPMMFHGLSALVFAQCDRIMIADIWDNGRAGIYSFCYSVAIPLSAIWTALGHAWIPDYFKNIKENKQEWLKEHSDNYMFLFTCLSCGYLMVGGEALKILGTKDYWSGITVMPLITLSCYFQFLYSFPVNYEMYSKKTKAIGAASTTVAIMNIGLNWLLIPRYAMLGAAIATLTAYFLLFLIHAIIAKHMEGYHYKWYFYIKGLFPVMVCFVLTYVFEDYMIVRWGIGICIAIMLIWRVLKKKTLL